MHDDIAPPKLKREKPKRIEPLPKPDRKSLADLAAEEDWVANNTEEIETISLGDTPVEQADTSEEPARKKFELHLTKQQKLWGAAGAVMLAFGIGAGWTLTHHKRAVVAEAPHKATVIAKKPAEPIYSALSGLPVADASANNRPVTGVMIENSLDARPQSGLSQAGVVFEAVAEGGVTRFLALFQDQQPTNIGPIRSARPYYVSWDMGFDAPYAHVGGSADALADITSWHVKDLNQFYNGGAYHRISSRDAPHNVYTGVDTLTQLEGTKGYSSSSFTSFPRKADAASKTPTASSISFKLSGPTYDPSYSYDAATNSYKRSEAGEAHTDANTGAQLSPKVVIAIAVPLSQGALDASGAYYSNYDVIGSGQAWIFQDGAYTQATWTKTDNAAQITFTDAAGQPIPLNRGQTWISAVTDSGKVSYQ